MLRKTTTENGQVRGLPAADPRITAYKGIPFAAPPVGPNRWRAPQPAANWAGVRECLEFAPIPMQRIPGVGPEDVWMREWNVDPDVPMSEDCLYLNVWTPAKTGAEKLPVMVWIYGGAYQNGNTAEMEFDGERIARRGIVLVTVAYRVNAFGFLAHPELVQEDPNGCYGNYGLLDQMAGLQWVRRNIAAFGGDPGNITLFGQSAGAGSVICQVTSPMAQGLMQKAIMQSGGGLRAYGQGSRSPDLQQALATGERFFAQNGLASLAQARALDEVALRDMALAFGGPEVWSPTVDGRFLLQDPSDAILAQKHADIPYLFGYTANEFDRIRPQAPVTLAGFEAMVREKMGDQAEAFLQLCNVHSDAEAAALMQRDNAFNGHCINNLAFARKQVEFGRKGNFMYRFQASIPGWDNPGAFHSSELWFMFETLAKCWRPFTGKHYDLARVMCNYWTNFAKTGNPNGDDADGSPMPRWEEFTADNQFVIALSEEQIAPCEDLATELLEFRLRHISKSAE